MSTLTFAASMEKGIGANIEKLKPGCSPELCNVLELLSGFQREFELVMVRAQSLSAEQNMPELDTEHLLGSDENWRKLTGAFSVDSPPICSGLYSFVERACHARQKHTVLPTGFKA